jgi:hypothetical protein
MFFVQQLLILWIISNKLLGNCYSECIPNDNYKCINCAEKQMYFYNNTCYNSCPDNTYLAGGSICIKSVNQELRCNDEICNFHGTCKVLMNQINCECQAGYIGYNCQYTGFNIDDFLSRL